jgi:hypothetical protein
MKPLLALQQQNYNYRQYFPFILFYWQPHFKAAPNRAPGC